ncbi:AraC family transcriptional regulator [Paraburkholderia aspalathi]|uniref:AraC family transcriptional regulator n=1 Tax=Paraburkholderia aspalathi TaxID=1324617 RepID=UPI00190E041F|nr:helix-turn-helix transcriptional regulator [Paraburkholderia aspalathi]MBK3839476.1 helix-turn-helix transcriptional regulator [Paraburkholderia aspalathi]MCP2084704.1 AraC-like DNA-binding protein [Paraburkholderia sediminicola]CAE6697231.1 HTH-type transcriptional regulator NimR [Paraburkholderia aspalathi]CAE6860291.1 HTH-type transcriptional regulator NimR [Paraburkholderia aspalathi]
MTRPKLQTFGESFAGRKVIAQAIDYVDGTHEIAHCHHRAQLVYATSGIVRAITPLGLWMLTPGNALLIGSQIEHELHMVGQVSMRTLYIEPDSLAPQKQECRVIPVGDLLRATILGMFDSGPDEAGESRTALIVPLILRLLEDAADAADAADGARTARLPLPANARLRNICESLIAQPASNDTLELWADRVGASSRTVARLFRQETGMSFGQWREQLRLAEAMSKLSVGHAASQVAQDLGYADVRTFTVMFRRAFGSTPQQFRQQFREPPAI